MAEKSEHAPSSCWRPRKVGDAVQCHRWTGNLRVGGNAKSQSESKRPRTRSTGVLGQKMGVSAQAERANSLFLRFFVARWLPAAWMVPTCPGKGIVFTQSPDSYATLHRKHHHRHPLPEIMFRQLSIPSPSQSDTELTAALSRLPPGHPYPSP